MRFAVLISKVSDPQATENIFFETDDLEGARAVAMRLAFDERNLVTVVDRKYGEPVEDFDSPRHRS